MKQIIKTILRVFCILLFIISSFGMLPHLFRNFSRSEDGIGAFLGGLLAYLLVSSPGLYAIKIMFFSQKNQPSR